MNKHKDKGMVGNSFDLAQPKKMRFLMACSLFYFLSPRVFSQQAINTSPPHSFITSYSRKIVDVFSFSQNPASLVHLKKLNVALYGEKRFLLENHSIFSTAFGFPTQAGNFGLYYGYSGCNEMNEMQMMLAYARPLGNMATIGVQFGGILMNIRGYGVASFVHYGTSLILHLNDQLSAGVYMANPVSPGSGKNGFERLPFVYSLGAGFDVSDNFYIGCGLEKIQSRPAQMRAGMQYRLAEKISAGFGMLSGNPELYLGLGFLLKGFKINTTAKYHPHLGMSPAILLSY